MHLEFAFLAEAAMYGANRAICALGIGINRFPATALPLVYPHMAFVFCVRFDPDESEALHAISVQLVDPDGISFGSPEQFAVRPIEHLADTAEPLYFAQIIEFRDTRFVQLGRHELRLYVNNTISATVVVTVEKA